MPLIDLQRRMRELGRLRLGVKEAGGPKRIDTWRLTSHSRDLIESAAALYGGEPREWQDAPSDAEQWEVITDATSLPIAIPPGVAMSQWYEQWKGGRIERRCDGEYEQISERNCLCNPEDRECKPTTRLNVMLPELWDIGVWRMESRGIIAAIELAGVVGLLEHATARGVAVQARLRIDSRTVRKPNERYPRHFSVPVIEVASSLGALLNNIGMLEGGPRTDDEPMEPLPAPDPEPERPSRTGVAPRTAKQRDEVEREMPAPPDNHEPPPPPQGASHSEASLTAMALRSAGVDDEDRPAFLRWLTGQTSARDLDEDQHKQARATAKDIKEGRLELTRTAGGLLYAAAPGSHPGDEKEAHFNETTPGTMTTADFKEAMKEAHGIGPVTLLNRARELAGERDEEPPRSINDLGNMSAEAQDALMAWLEGE